MAERVEPAARAAPGQVGTPANRLRRAPARGVLNGQGAASLTSMNSLPDAPALLCDRAGLVVRASEAAAALAAVDDPDQLVGLHIDALLIGAEPDLRLCRPGMPGLPVRVVRWRVPGSGLDAVLLTDVSQLLTAEEELRLERRRLAEVQALTGIGWWEFDHRTKLAVWSPSLYGLLGIAPGSVEPSLASILEFIHPDDAPTITELWRRHQRHGEPIDVECRVVRPDGELRWMHAFAAARPADPAEVLVTGYARDVTDRRRDRDMLAADRAALLDAQRIAKMGSFRYDLATNTTWRSAALDEMYAEIGVQPGSDPLANVDPEQLPAVQKLSDKLTETSIDAPLEVEVDGEVGGRIYLARAHGIFDADQKVIGMAGTIQDVTEHRQLQRQLMQDRRRFEVAQRVAMLGAWEWNPDTDECVWSPMLRELLGVGPETHATYQKFLGLVVPQDRSWVDERFRQLARDRKPVECEYQISRSDGAVRTLRCYGASIPGSGSRIMIGTAQDVTDQRIAETRMLRSSQRFTDLVALTPVGIGLFDDAERLVDANDALCDLLGTSLEKLRGRTADQLGHPGDTTQYPSIRAERGGNVKGRRKVPQRVLVRADGEPIYCDLHIAVSVQDDGQRFWLVVFQDVTERRRAAEALRHQANHDELTGLPNRAAVKELLGQLLRGPAAATVAVLFCDIDNFKRVNDSLGHDAGDELLVALARRLEGGLPDNCTVARLSGDEYVIICADIGALGGVGNLANLVSSLLRTAVPVHGQLVRVSASIGAAVPNGEESTGADLLRFADAAMFEAKAQGAGRVSVASAALIASADRQVHLEGQLRDALSTDGLTLHYQPVVDADGTILTAEALVRWPHPERGMLGPDVFLPVAEQGGLLRELDRWVLRTALHEAGDWSKIAGHPVAVAVNLAGLVPGDAEFVDAVSNAVLEADIDWDRVVLELVETSLVDLPSRTRAAMAALVAKGVRFAVDDFGTGYSSLARLKDLPAQIIKVDRRFVAGVGSDSSDFAVASAVVDMSRAMGRNCIAEGVETATQFHVLRGMGVDAYQGWLFSRAIPAKEFRAMLKQGPLHAPSAG
ncbi:MAG TPA: EAL domain-containing protein [Pseudonocardiaceae bacterium]|nr:EAL domain-containing protein [Pseudonocardiaceae bacterium]